MWKSKEINANFRKREGGLHNIFGPISKELHLQDCQ